MINLNPLANRLNKKLQDLQLKLDSLLTDSPESSDVLDVQLEIEDTREKLRLESEKLVNSETATTSPLFYKSLKQKFEDAQENVNNLKVRRGNLRELTKDYERKIESLSAQERGSVYLTRDTEVNRKIYEMLLVKAEENRITAEETKEKGTRYEILEGARLPLRPSKPQKLLIGIIAFVVGSLSGFGSVFLVEFTDHSFHNVEDAKKFLRFPIIGSIAKVVNKEEIAIQKSHQKRVTVFLIIFFSLLIIGTAISSFIQERKITQEIIKIEDSGK